MTGKTTREHWLAGDPPRDRDERAKYVEYEAAVRRRVSDADLAYERQEAILNGKPADVSAEAMFSALFARSAS